MARERYDSKWKEVQDINRHVLLIVYVTFMLKGLGVLVFTWNTVVLLGGYVSMIDKRDFFNLTTITSVQIIWIDDNFGERVISALHMFIWSIMALVRGTWQLAHNAWGNRLELPSVKRVIAVVPSLLYGVIFCLCIFCALSLYVYGLPFTAWISIIRLMEQDHYGDKGEGRTNMDPAHNLMYILCVAQFVLYLNRYMLRLQEKMIMKQVSQAYGFHDNDSPVVGYYHETMDGCMQNPFFDRERNLVTYSLELMESNTNSPLNDDFLSGTLILDRLLTRQHSDKIIRAPSLTQQEEEIHQQQQQQQWDLGESEPLIQKEKVDTIHIVQQSNMKRQQQQQTEEEVIVQQRRMIKRLIGDASSTHIVQKLLETLDSRRASDKKMREAAARIVEHIADGIRLELFPRGIQCIASLINTFEEYRQLQPDQSSSSSSKKEATRMTLPLPPNTENGQGQGQGSSSINISSSEWKPEYSESESEPDSDSEVDGPSLSEVLTRLRIRWRRIISKGSSTAITTSSKSKSDNGMDRPSSSQRNRSKSNPFHGYKELVLTGLHILWRLAASKDNCTIIIKTKHLVSKIMAPVSYDLVHLAGHSAWSTQVVERSLGVILRLIVNTKGDTGADLCKQIKGSIATMKKIVVCEECKGRQLQMKAMQILTQLCVDETANKGNLTKVLVSIFVNGDNSNDSIKKTAGETLVVLYLGSISVTTLLPKEENDEFVGDLAKILVQVGGDDTCRKSAAEILEHLCIHYAENVEYLSTLKNTITGVMPEVLREICHGSTGEEEKPEYARSDTDLESQSKTKKNSSSSPTQNQQHKLHVALLSLCMMAYDKLNLDQGESVTFSLVTKMVQLNRDIITPDSLTTMKLTTRMVIAAMQKLGGHFAGVKQANLESLLDSLSSISETMLDLEGCMVFAAGTTMKIPATADTLNSLVKQARQLHAEIQDQDSEIVPAS